MSLRIEPYKYENNCPKDGAQITYWAVFMNEDKISVTSTREKAEQTKQWMEQWLGNKN